ncbi:Rv3235 family protein [Amycolatopsis sp. cg5]|uniref:Rv3235 family protein n=1 Tax=Amycolatopsis sp. cg5 TaxID=3238802 RepID=UPI003524FCEE
MTAVWLRPLAPFEPTRRAATRPPRVRQRLEDPDGQLSLDLELSGGRRRRTLTSAHELPPDNQKLGRMIRMILETCDGRRPPGQVRPLVSLALYERLVDRRRALGVSYTMRTIHTCYPADGAIEACATVEAGPRVFAAAARFERNAAGWRCCRFEVLETKERGHRKTA